MKQSITNISIPKNPTLGSIGINLPKILFGILFAMLFFVDPTSYAASKSESKLLKQQDDINADLNNLQKDLVKIANKTSNIQEKIIRIEERMGLIISQEHQQRKIILDDNKKLGDTLSAIIQIAERPDRLFLIYPGDGLAAVHSHLLITHIVPHMQNRIQNINNDILALVETQKKLESEKILFFETQEDLAEHTIRIQRLVEEKQKLLNVTKSTLITLKKENEKLKKEARNLTELVKKASKQKTTLSAKQTIKPKNIRTFPTKGKITLPANGKFVRKFGQKTAFGANSRGVVLRTRGNAQIVATFDGKIVFSGEFQNQGKMLIIEHKGDYHTVISGLGDLYAKRGQWVLQGEPIGKMPKKNPELYVELRRKGQHINPDRWLS